MKKHLIAAAVAAAVAVPAMAQVTVGGNFDLAYDFGKANKTAKTTRMNTLSTSTLALRGTEDLGGGLKAFFNVTSGFSNPFNVPGNAAAGNSQGGINFGDRGAQIGISGAFGEVALGKTTATAFGGTIRGGVVGNLSLIDSSSWGDRPNSMVSYTSPSFSGLRVRYITQTTTQSYELSASYAAGPLNVTVAMNDVKAVAPVTDKTTAVVAGKDTGARASYNFGLAAVNVSYIQFGTLADQPANTKRDRYSVGLTIPVPQVKGLTLAVDTSNHKAAADNSNGERKSLSAVYTLSKRTNVYFAMVDHEDDIKDLTTAGIRHSF